jgi:hypothetical protein
VETEPFTALAAVLATARKAVLLAALAALVLSASSGAQDAPSLQLIRVTCNG